MSSLQSKYRYSSLVLFITNGNYDDYINNNIIEWEGQNSKTNDHLIFDDDKCIYIFYRKKTGSLYCYLGKVIHKEIITQRSEIQKLKVKFTMEKIS